ncbi:Arc family DNA-binding protein [Novacetimonas hansenii]|uniref:Arc family DNA-binding protein n=1 Tax=Novacetimonas hansenii TaxID=436 RepID=UPI00111537BB|nr:Arc family DNA-binding protein [Novacetimonas hansenii]
MNDDLPDSLFKLRLPGAMREKLEKDATRAGRTLTAEILARLESTFSNTSGRIDRMERIVMDKKIGNDALHDEIKDLKEHVDGIMSDVIKILIKIKI